MARVQGAGSRRADRLGLRQSIRIAAGFWKTAKLFAANNAVTSLDIVIDGARSTIEVPRRRDWLELPVGRAVTSIGIAIAAATRSKMNDSCISGITPDTGDDDAVLVRNADAAAVAALPRAIAALQVSLGKSDHAGLEQLVELPFTNHPAAGFFEGDPPATTYKTYAALAAACEAADAEDAPRSALLRCPSATSMDETDDRGVLLRAWGPGTVVVEFPSHREVVETWQLHWNGRAWRLAAIDYD